MAGSTNPTKIGFTGHVNDPDTGLVYMQQRYYDPIAGRFLSVDPIAADANTGKGFGLYTYVDNNPYTKVDPDGREPKMGECGWAQGQCTVYGGSSSSGSGREAAAKVGAAIGFTAAAAGTAICAGASYGLCAGLGPEAVILGAAGGAAGGMLIWDGSQALLRYIGSLIKSEGADGSGGGGDSKPQKPNGVPNDWKEEPGKKDGNTKWVNPENPHDYVRAKPDGTVTQVRNGKAYDVNGNRVDLKSPGAHNITPDQFVFRP